MRSILSLASLASLAVAAPAPARFTKRDSAALVQTARDNAAASKILAQWYPTYHASHLPVDQIDWSTMNMAFWFVQETQPTGLNATLDADIQTFVEGAHAANVPVLFTIGGWTGGLYFSSVVADDELRAGFVQDISDFVDKYGIEGVDIDWEYPNSQGIGCNNISKADTTNLATFLTELRTKLGDDKLITADVATSGFVGPDGNVMSDVTPITDSLDFINVMNYDLYGSWTATTGPNGGLSNACDGGNSATNAVAVWTGAGVKPEQIILGIPAYGHTWITNVTELETKEFTFTDEDGTEKTVTSQMFQTHTDAHPQGDWSDSEGIDVCGVNETYGGNWEYSSMIAEGWLQEDELTGGNGFTRYFDSNCSSTPFLWNSETGRFVAYDDQASVGIKASWALQQKLAGTNFFDSTGITTKLMKAAQLAVEDPAQLWAMGLPTIVNATTTVNV